MELERGGRPLDAADPDEVTREARPGAEEEGGEVFFVVVVLFALVVLLGVGLVTSCKDAFIQSGVRKMDVRFERGGHSSALLPIPPTPLNERRYKRSFVSHLGVVVVVVVVVVGARLPPEHVQVLRPVPVEERVLVHPEGALPVHLAEVVEVQLPDEGLEARVTEVEGEGRRLEEVEVGDLEG